MKVRKLLATLLALAMTLSMLSVGAFAAETEDEKNGVMPISETEQTAPVSTLPADAAASWAADSIERWTATGVVKGDGNGNFNPDAPLSRAELAQIFVNMFGLTVKAENTFADLKGDEWYADAILKCVAAGIMKGDGVNANAEAKITRAETIVMFGRAVGVTPDANPDLSKFTDADSVADWAAGYMAPLTKMGILSGSGDGTINAGGQIDRASTMALMDKAVAEYVNAPGEYKVDNANGFVIVNVAAKEGEVVISGTAAGVAVSAGTAEGKVVAKDLKADTIKVDGTAAVSVEGKSTVGEITANATGSVTVAKGVTVDTLTVNAAAKVTNNGTVNTANFNTSGSTWSGSKPKEVNPGPGITPPVTEQPSGGGGGDNGPSATASKLDTDVVAVNTKWPWAGAPDVSRVSPTYTTSGYTIKATGAVNEVTGFTGFNTTVEAEQQGFYVTLRIVIPTVAYDTEDAVIWYSKDFGKSQPGTVFKNDPDHCLDLIMRVGDIGATSLKNFQFKVDWDGAKSGYSAQTYTVDLSELVPVNAAQETALLAVKNAGDKATMKTALEANAATFGIDVGAESVYGKMHESRQPSVCQYVIDSKPYTTPAAVKAAFDMGVKYEAAKWDLSTKILANGSKVEDFTALKAVYEEHAAYRASIGLSLEADAGYLAAISAMTHVTAAYIIEVETQFNDNTAEAGGADGTNAYRLNDVFAFINAKVIADDETAPVVSGLTAKTNAIQFTATDNVGVVELEIDSVVYSGETIMDSDADFNIPLPITPGVLTAMAEYGITAEKAGDSYTISIVDYAKFAAYIQGKATSDLYPTKIHFYVVAKDASGMGSPELGEPTAAQCDLTLTLPEELKATSEAMLVSALGLVNEVTVEGAVTLANPLTIPAGKTLNVLTGATLTNNSTIRVNAGGAFCLNSDADGSTNTKGNIVGADSLNVTAGYVTVTSEGDGMVLTIPADSAAKTVDGCWINEAKGNTEYRVAKNDKLVVEGTLTVGYDVKITGKLTLGTTGNLVVESGKELKIAHTATVVVVDGDPSQGEQTLVGNDNAGLDITEGYATLTMDTLTLTTGTEATTKGAYMDGALTAVNTVANDDYRVTKNNKLVVADGATLNVEFSTKVTGQLIVDGILNILEDSTLEVVCTASGHKGILTVNGKLTGNGEINNNGTATIAAFDETGRSDIWSTADSSLTLGETKVVGGDDAIFGLVDGTEIHAFVTDGVINYDVRQTGKGNDENENEAGLVVTLQNNLAMTEGALFVKNGLTLELAESKTITLSDEAGLELYEGAKISNINETEADGLTSVTITEGVITGYYNCDAVTATVILTGKAA